MGRVFNRGGLIAGLCLTACTTTAPDPLARALVHAQEPGDTIGGSGADRVSEQLGLRTAESASWWLAPVDEAVPSAPHGYSAVLDYDGLRLWRRRDPLAATDAAVLTEGLAQIPMAPEGGAVRGFEQQGTASPGGELVGTVFVQPPARMPRRPCLSLGFDGHSMPLGELLQGRGAFVPGAGPRPTFAHRFYRPVPKDWPVGTFDVQVQLHTCDTGLALAPATPVSLTIDVSGRPTAEQLIARAGVADSGAEWTQLKGRKEAIHRAPDGSLEVRPAPPLPRVLRGDAFGLVVAGPVDPSSWPDARGTVGPLHGIGGLFEEADAAVVSFDAVAARAGQAAANVLPRRVTPETLGHIAALDVQGVLFSAHGGDAGAAGLAESAGHANRLGLRSHGQWVDLDVGSGDNAVSVRLIHVNGGKISALKAAIAKARQQAGDALLLVEVEGALSAESAAQAIFDAGADGGWIVADALGPVWLQDGVPVLLGLPPLDASHRLGIVPRWYVAPLGIARVDLQSVVLAGSRWTLDREAAGREALLQAAVASDERGVWLAVGQNMAAVDVNAHGPDRARQPARPRDLPLAETGLLELPSLPARCGGTLSADAVPRAVGPDLMLMDARITDATGPMIEVELWWQSSAALPVGRLGWYVDGVSVPWRGSTVPCEGSWGFEHFVPGQLVRDTVRLAAPAEAKSGVGHLWLDVRIGDERLNIGAERRLDLGEVSVP